MRFQIYCALSFGARSISHFCYCTPESIPGSNTVYKGAMISIDGNKSETWYNGRDVNYELHRLSETYLQYDYLGAFLLNEDPDLPYMHFSKQYSEFSYLEELICDDPLLVGCFVKKDNSGFAFTLVNLTDLWQNKSINVTFKTVPCKEVCIYTNGYPKKIRPNKNYTVELPCGNGVFVKVDF